MSMQKIFVICICIIIILLVSWRKSVEAAKDLKELDDLHYYSEEDIENFQIYSQPCNKTPLERCFTASECGLSTDSKGDLYCQSGDLQGPWDYDTKTWIYNGKCWGENCSKLLPIVKKRALPFDPNNPISPYIPGYQIIF